MQLVTEEQVRRWLAEGEIQPRGEFIQGQDQLLTPSAIEYFHANKIIIRRGKKGTGNKGQGIKPEHKTHLRGDLLVDKDHPVIAFRGEIDDLEAEIILTQLQARQAGYGRLVGELTEVVTFVHSLIAREITGEELGEYRLCGLSADDIREHSHHPGKYYGIKHFLPSYEQGEMPAYLNKLRTRVRKVELAAYRAFKRPDGAPEREDIIRALNRMSSLFWIMMIKFMAGFYSEQNNSNGGCKT